MESYVVRIYRRDYSDPERLTGLLESVERGTRAPFQSLSGLRELLVPATDREKQPAESLSETNS